MRPFVLPLAFLLLTLSACQRPGAPEKAESVATAMDTSRTADALLLRTYVFLCDKGFRFVARTDGGVAHVYLPGTRQLHYRQLSDTLYRGPEGALRLWIDPAAAASDSASGTTPAAARAVLVADGSERTGCTNQPMDVPWANAQISGVSFRAVGHAPQPWNLDLYGLDSLAVFVTDDGRTRWRMPSPAYELRVASEEAFYRSTVQGQPFEVHLQGRSCTDTRTGRRFPTTVTVTYRGARYDGCGRELN